MPAAQKCRAKPCQSAAVASAASGRSYIGRVARFTRLPARRIVIVAGVFEMDVLHDLQARRRIDAAHGHVELAAADALPEQLRAADPAEAAANAGRGFEPAEIAVALDPVALRGRQGVDAERAMMAPAHAAMAGRGRRQRAFDLVAHAAAEAAAGRLAPAHAGTGVMEWGSCSSPSVISSKSAFSETKMWRTVRSPVGLSRQPAVIATRPCPIGSQKRLEPQARQKPRRACSED